MNRLALVALLVVGGLGAYRAMQGGGQAKWRRADVVVAGKALSVELPAAPRTSANDVFAEAEDIAFVIAAVENGALATQVTTGSAAVGQAIANGLSDHWAAGSASYAAGGISIGGMRGVELKLDGSGARGRGRLWVVSDGRVVVEVGCATAGGMGVGKRIAKMGEMCERFRQSVAAR